MVNHTTVVLDTEHKSPFYDVIRRCNKLQQDVTSLYQFRVKGNDAPLGYMLPAFVALMAWERTAFKADESSRIVSLAPQCPDGESIVEASQREFIALCRQNMDKIDGLRAWVDLWDRKSIAEYHPVRNVHAYLSGFKVPSPLRGVFGILTAGAHMNIYTVEPDGGKGTMRIWVAKRTMNVSYAGMLDQPVAGSMECGDNNDAYVTLRREAMEEAGLSIDSETRRVIHQGAHIGSVCDGSVISFYDKKDGAAGAENGQLEPGIRFTFDLRLETDLVLKPHEPRAIASFSLWSMDKIKTSLKRGEWKPNSALVMLDFLLRHDQLHPGEDKCYQMLRIGLQRQLPFNVF